MPPRSRTTRPSRGYDPRPLSSPESAPLLDAARVADLVAAARDAAQRAYAPASQFPVGAALLAADGRVFLGCNVENASYGLSICAERNAAFRMVADGARRIVAVAVWTDLVAPASPCGACRQVLSEFASPDCPVILAGRGSAIEHTTLGELLPRPFTFARLDESRS